MGPPSDKGGYVHCADPRRVSTWKASMGPPSDKGGYGSSRARAECCFGSLQWGHRPIRVVMCHRHQLSLMRLNASMGPPSDKGGYAGRLTFPLFAFLKLQWGHRPIRVVMCLAYMVSLGREKSFNGATVR